jgi:cytochrome c553
LLALFIELPTLVSKLLRKIQSIGMARDKNMRFFLEKNMIFGSRFKQLAVISTSSVIMMSAGSWAIAADIEAGKTKAGMCSTCHGPLGISQLPNAPHLAGQPAIYTSEQLKQYRDGKRNNAVMAVLAKPLTDKEIEDLSAWFESIKITVQEK